MARSRLPGSSGAFGLNNPIIRIGVLTDLSGPYSSISGPDGVTATKQAAAEFMAAVPSIQVEVIAADHQNKPDVGSGILRNWYDQGGVDMVTDLTNSAVALAANAISAEKDKVCLVTVGGSSALTGAACTPNLVHWTYDSWNLAHSTTTALVKTGGNAWYLVAPDYAYGKALVADATKFTSRQEARSPAAHSTPSPTRRISPPTSCERKAAARMSSPSPLVTSTSSTSPSKRTSSVSRKASGREAVAMMKKTPTDDDCFGKGLIRADGRKIHPAYLFEVKKPEDVHSFGDVYKLAYTTPADQAFRPIGEGGCPLVKA